MNLSPREEPIDLAQNVVDDGATAATPTGYVKDLDLVRRCNSSVSTGLDACILPPFRTLL
jgi:hypothetical protein